MKVEATVNRAPSVREKDCFDAGLKGRPSESSTEVSKFVTIPVTGSRGHLNLAMTGCQRTPRPSAWAHWTSAQVAEPVPLADIWSLSRARVAMHGHGPAPVQVIEDRMIHADRA